MSIIVNRNIVFLDSNQFYKGKLEDHASNLNNEDFKHLLSDFPIDQLELLKGKDAYLYDWVDSFEKFNYQELPPKQQFYSSINDDNNNGHISNEKYYNLQNVWNTFNFSTFRDFHNHYLKKDVLLLADVFKKFIFTCLKNYSLDPCHYFSAPGLFWNAVVKMTKVELEKMSSAEIHFFIEKGMRRGIIYASKGYSKANNESCSCLL